VLVFDAICFAALEATSAMSFFIPAIETVRIGDAWCTCWRSARALHRCPPTVDFDEASFVAHATAGVLSQKMPTCACLRCVGLMFSSTIQAKTTPAISRSAMASVPFLLLDVVRFCFISSGHSRRHTVGCIWREPFIHTPPTPCLDASTYAMNHGRSGVNSSTDVGREDILCNRCIQSDIVCLRAGVMGIVSLPPFIALLIGERRPRPPGNPKHAWFSLPASCCRL
jgi:hypothetical protein